MIVRDQKDLNRCINQVSKAKYITYDVETTGLNTRQDKVIGIGCSTSPTTGFYVPLLIWDGIKLQETGLDPRPLLQALKGKRLIAHNAAFDVDQTYHDFNIDLKDDIWADTMLMAHTLDENKYAYGLKPLSKALWGDDSTEEQQIMKQSIADNGGSANEYFKCDMEIMAKYCIKDCQLTFKLYNYFYPQLVDQDLISFFFEEEVMPLYTQVTIPMQRNGIPLDIDLIVESEEQIQKDINDLEDSIMRSLSPHLGDFEDRHLASLYPINDKGVFAQELCRIANLELPRLDSGKYSLTNKDLLKCEEKEGSNIKVLKFLQGGSSSLLSDSLIKDVRYSLFRKTGERYVFNLQSKHHLKNLFFKILQVDPISKTDKGNPQVDDKFLDAMAERYDWAEKLRVFNKLNKIKGAYIDRFIRESEAGLFYPSFFQHRTISGRYGSDLQQLPRPYEEGQEVNPLVKKYTNNVRKFFIAGEGHKFIDNDYESLEPHVFAHISGDEGLKNIFRNGDDFYSTIAIATEGLTGVSAKKSDENYLGKINKPLRQKAKAYALGIPYGMGDFALSKNIKIPQNQAASLIKSYKNSYPALTEWMERSEDQCRRMGFVRSEVGRVRHMPNAVELHKQYGPDLIDGLAMWKIYSEDAVIYPEVKAKGREMRKYLNNAKNFQVQSLAASIVNRAAIAINRKLNDLGIWGYVCAQVHDQLITRCKSEDAERVKNIVEDIMVNNYKLSIDLKAPAEIGDNFADAH